MDLISLLSKICFPNWPLDLVGLVLDYSAFGTTMFFFARDHPDGSIITPTIVSSAINSTSLRTGRLEFTRQYLQPHHWEVPTFPAIIRLDARIYLSGGGPHPHWCYDLGTQELTRAPAMSQSREAHSIVKLPHDHSFMVIGGLEYRQWGPRRLESCEVYNTLTRKWSDAVQLSSPRSEHASVLLNGYIYVLGGVLNPGIISSSCERYNIKTKQWESIAPLAEPRCLMAVVTIGTDSILVLGGWNDSTLDSIEEYRPSTNTWRTCTWTLPQPRRRFGVVYDDISRLLTICGGLVASPPCSPVLSRSQPFASTKWLESTTFTIPSSFGYCSL